MVYKITKKRFFVVAFLMILEVIFVSLAIRSYGNKNLGKYVMKLQNEDGTYLEVTDTNTFPTSGYHLNIEESECMNYTGNLVNDALSYDSSTKKVSVMIDSSISCYLYFDRD